MKKNKIRFICLVAVLVFLALLSMKLMIDRGTFIYGLVLLFAAAFAFLIWKAYIKNGREDLRRSQARSAKFLATIGEQEERIAQLSRELDEKSRARLNVVGLSPILHVAVLNVDSSFVRTYVRKEKGIEFNGALRAEISAEYGVRLEEAHFHYDSERDVLRIANFRPGLISYSKKQLSWQLARSFRILSIFGKEMMVVSDGVCVDFTRKQCEILRDALEKEIDDRKIEEFDWLSPMISQEVADMFRMIIGRPGITIEVVDEAGEGFVDYQSFQRQLARSPLQLESGQDTAEHQNQ